MGGKKVLITPAGDVVRLKDGQVLASGLGSLEFASPVVQGDTAFFVGSESEATAVKLPAKPEPFKADAAWTKLIDEGFNASAVVHEGLLHAVSEMATYYVIDTKSGKIILSKPLPITPAEGDASMVFASVCLAGKYLFICNDSGDTLVLEPGRTFSEVSLNHLGKGTAGTPTFAGKHIYLRSGERLFCLANK